MPTPNTSLQFLSGGGQMSERIRAFDWTTTPLGPPAQWSQSLKTSVNLMLNSQQPVWIGWGRDNTFLYNDPYIEVLGLAKHQWALGRPAGEVWAEIWDFCGPLSDKVYSHGESSFVNDVHFFMNRGDSLEEVFYSFSYSPIYDETGKVGGLFCPNIETTAKMLNERRLHTLSELASKALVEKTIQAACATAFATVARNSEDVPFALLYLMDPAQETAVLEQSAGLAEEDAAIRPRSIPLHSNGVETSPWPLSEVLQDARSQVVAVGHLAGLPTGLAGLPVTQAVALPVAASGQARPLGVLIAGVNPTRRLDAEYATFYDLLAGQVATAIQNARAAEEERRRAEALAEVDRAKTVFFSNISHEFRTPLTLMLGSLEELLRNDGDGLEERHMAVLDTTHRNAMRLLRLVNALLDFSRIESGRARANFRRTDLARYTADLASNFRSVMEKGGLDFRVECPPLDTPVYVDPAMWEKIVLNLLSNAFKYTLRGSVTVRLSARDGQAVLEVEDTGVGIPAAELPRMFERFHRVENAVGRTFEGTGIGLSLVSELVALHGGEISVSSVEGAGSTFTVRLPLGSQHLPAGQVVESGPAAGATLTEVFLEESVSLLDTREAGNGTAGADEHQATVLVVDDNADMRAHIRNLLARHYRVVTATNGAEALARVAEHAPALILSDIMMPVMDGFALLKAVKENPQTAHLPVVLLSARAGEEARIEGFDVGADDYLVKPFSARELLARIRSQIRLSHTRQHLEQQLRNLFMQAPVALCIFRGPDFVVEVANDQMLELWGKTAAQVIYKPVMEALPEIEGQGFDRLLDGVYRTGERFVAPETPVELLRQGRLEKLYVKFVYEALRGEDGRITGIMAVADDITAQVLARHKTEENENRFRTLAETLPQLVWMTDANGRQEYASSRWEAYTGIQPTGAETWSQVVHADDLPQIAAAWSDSMAAGTFYRAEVRLRDRHGRYRWHFVQGEPIRDGAGSIVQWIGAFTDIHDQKTLHDQLEQQVAERTAALHHSNESLEANNRQLLRANLELESFNYVASHDLQEPLRKIQTFANLLQVKTLDPETTSRYLDKIHSASRRMSDLVQALLQYSRLANDTQFEDTDLDRIFEEVKNDLELRIEETGAVVRHDSLPTVPAIPLQMHQLFANLLANALKFTDKPPVVQITTRPVPAAEVAANRQLDPEKSYVEIAFRDNGIGFEPHFADKIFHLFKRLHTRDQYSGTGIGLSICKKIVEHHGGCIRAESVEGEGSVFTVWLPLNP
jgi:PAS domain S-box-containing protein